MDQESCEKLLFESYKRFNRLGREPEHFDALEEAFEDIGITLPSLVSMTTYDLDYYMNVAPSYDHVTRSLRKRLQKLRSNITVKPRSKLIRPDDMGFCGALLIASRKYYREFKAIPFGYEKLEAIYRSVDVKMVPLKEMTPSNLRLLVRKAPSYKSLTKIQKTQLLEFSKSLQVAICSRMHDYLVSIGLDLCAEKKTILDFAAIQTFAKKSKIEGLNNCIVSVPKVLYNNPYKQVDLDTLLAFAKQRSLRTLVGFLKSNEIKKFIVNKGPVGINDLTVAAQVNGFLELTEYIKGSEESLKKGNSLGFYSRIPFIQLCLEMAMFTVYPYLIGTSNKMQSSINNLGSSVEDKFQEQVNGFLIGMLWWDPVRDNGVTTYATYWSKQISYRAEIDHERTVRYPVHIHEALKNLTRDVQIERRRLFTEDPTLTYQASQQALHEMFDDTLEQILISKANIKTDLRYFGEFDIDMLDNSNPHFGQNIIELDQILDPFEELTLIDTIQAPAIESTLFMEQVANNINYVVSTLTPREGEVISMRYLAQPLPLTLQKIGEVLNSSRERIRQVEAKALRKLRAPGKRGPLVSLTDYNGLYSTSIATLQDKYLAKSSDFENAFTRHDDVEGAVFLQLHGVKMPESMFELALFLQTREESTLKRDWLKAIIKKTHIDMPSGDLNSLHPNIETCVFRIDQHIDSNLNISCPHQAIELLFDLHDKTHDSDDLIERFIGKCLLAFLLAHPSILLSQIVLGEPMESPDQESDFNLSNTPE